MNASAGKSDIDGGRLRGRAGRRARGRWIAWGMVAASVIMMGCAQKGDRVLPFTPDPLGEAKTILRSYAAGPAAGQPVSSESLGFDDLVERVRQADAGKADKLRVFFDDVRKKGVSNPVAAKKLLDEL